MKKIILLFILPFISLAQSTLITPGNGQPNILANSTNNGIVPSQMTYNQIIAIPSPATGTLVFDTDFKVYRYWDGTNWVITSMPCKEGCTGCDMPGSTMAFAAQNDMIEDSQGNLVMAGATIGKYTPSGNLISVIIPSQGNNITHRRIKYDAAGNLYIYGSYTQSSANNYTYLGQALKPLTNSSYQGLFIAKINTSNQLVWLQSGFAQQLSYAVFAFELDLNGNIYAFNNFETALTFDNITVNSMGGVDIMYLKIDATGTVQQFGNMGGVNNQVLTCSKLVGNDIYLGGWFAQNASFGANNLATTLEDSFLAKYNTNFVNSWANKMGSVGGISRLNTIDIYSNSVIVGGGSFSGTLGTFTSAGQSDIFLSIISSSNGAISIAKQIGGTDSESLQGLLVKNNSIYLSGTFIGVNMPYLNYGAVNQLINGNLSGISTMFIAKTDMQFFEWKWAKPVLGTNQINGGTSSLGSILNTTNSIYFGGSINAQYSAPNCIKCLTTSNFCNGKFYLRYSE